MSSLKLFDEADYFTCDGGLKPAPLKKNQEVVQREDGNYYLTEYSLQCKGIDFSCRWIALLIAIVAAAIALLCSCPAGWVLLAAIAGAAGGSILAGKICGDKAAIMRVWLVIKEDALFDEFRPVVDRLGPHLTCNAFGNPIRYNPNIKSELEAIILFGGNIIETGLEGFMWVYAARGGGMFLTNLKAFFFNFGVNYLKSWSVKGLAIRSIFGGWSGYKAYLTSETEGFDIKQSGTAALQSFYFVEMAMYNAATERDPRSIALLLSMTAMQAGGKTGQKNALGMEKVADATKTDLYNSVAKVKNGVKSAIKIAKEVREKLKSQKKGNGAHEELAKLITQRKQQAIDFYQKHTPNLDVANIESHIAGIDFTKPIEIVHFPKGTKLIQYTKVNSEGTVLLGDYYTDNPANTPSELGVSDTYNVKDPNNGWKQTQEVKKVVKETITLPKDAEGLKSTAAEIEDTWSRINKHGNNIPIQTEGGGSQIYLPKSQLK